MSLKSNLGIKELRNDDVILETSYGKSICFQERRDVSGTNAHSEETDWVCKIVGVNSSDLRVVAMGSFNSKKVSRGNCHQDTEFQNRSNKNTTAKEIPAHGEQEVQGIQNESSDNTTEEIPAHGDQCEQEVDEGFQQNEKTRGKQIEEEPSTKALNQDNNHDTREKEDTEIKNGKNKSTAAEGIPADGDQNEQEVDEGFICKLCDLSVKTSDEYYNHLKTHCSGKCPECPMCKKVFKKMNHLFLHFQFHLKTKQTKVKHSKGELNTCSEHNSKQDGRCYYKNKVSSPGNLKKHEPIHSAVKPHACQHSKKGVPPNQHLEKSENPHAYIKFYECTLCDKAFSRPSYLTAHKRTHKGIKPYKCKYCEKAFDVNSNRYVHQRVHKGVKPYKCKQCGKAFSERWTLKVHERVHTGVKPYKCKVCNKAFPQQSSLKKHERVHTGDKPHKCQYCKKAFTEKGNLNIHERIHTGDKRHKCRYCDKTFIRRGDLEKHERIHTGDKPYKCKYCKKAFSQQGSVRIHERIHTRVS